MGAVKGKIRAWQLTLLLICLFQKSSQNCFTLECSLKIADEGADKIVDEWEYETCGHNLSCEQANDRVYNRCRKYPKTSADFEKICSHVSGFPTYPDCLKTGTDACIPSPVDVYLQKLLVWMIEMLG